MRPILTFGWDQTPHEVFTSDERGFVRRIRLAEQQLAIFLQEWYGTLDGSRAVPAMARATSRRRGRIS